MKSKIFAGLAVAGALLSLLIAYRQAGPDVYGAGLFSWPSMGRPKTILEPAVRLIAAHRAAHGAFPDADAVAAATPHARNVIFYTTASDAYQLAYWSGETTWVYDSRSEHYVETREDIAKRDWFADPRTSPRPEDARRRYAW